MRRIFAYVILVMGLSYTLSFAQQITGNLEGRVLDSTGKPVPVVNIIISSSSLQGVRGTASDDRGYFRALALPVGLYSVTISHIAFQTTKYKNVSVRLGKTTTLGEVPLQPKTIEMSDVIVTAAKPSIDPTSTSSGGNLSDEEYEFLPVERNFRSITTLLPHSNASFFGDEVNFAGGTGHDNMYFIDGVNVTDPRQGLTSIDLPYNFVREIETRIGGYQAEYRSALGGVVNVVTYSGSNEFHSQAFGFFNNNQLVNNPRIATSEFGKGNFSQYDAGFSLQGPVVRDKLWFFGAYNPNFRREEIEFPGLGFLEDKTTVHIFAGKLKWQLNSKANLTFSLFGNPGSREAIGVLGGLEVIFPPSNIANRDVFMGDVELGGITKALKGQYIASKNMLLEVSFSRISWQDKNLPLTERGRSELSLVDLETNIYSGGYPEKTDASTLLTTVGLQGTFLIKKHSIKAGLEYQDNRLDFYFGRRSFLRFNDSFFAERIFLVDGIVHNRVPSFFVQDAWQVLDRLTLNAGLRWDGQYLIGSNGKIAQRINDQFQPRIGFIYQQGKAGTQKLFGSFGRFYHDLSTSLSSKMHFEGAIDAGIGYNHDPRVDPSGGIPTPVPTTIHPEVEGLEGQHFDEFTLGYERMLGETLKIGVRGIYRTLKQGIETAFTLDTNDLVYGNPGKGKLSGYPKMTREHTALELTFKRSGGERFNYLASYVLSRNFGNYTGLFDTDLGTVGANRNGSFNNPNVINEGLLPNDRTHVLKFSGSYNFNFGLTIGSSFLWQSGTPLSEFGASPLGPFEFAFVNQRGTAGRTPSLWDSNFRFVYDLSRLRHLRWNTKLILDIFHLFSEQEPVSFDQMHYRELDANGNQSNPSPTYNLATRYQPPMSVRLGFEVGF